MGDSIDREKLREAIKTVRSVVNFNKSLTSWTLIVSAAEAHLATLPEPKDWCVIEWGPSERVRVYTPAVSKADADELAASWNAKHLDRRYVVVQRPA